MKAQEKNKIFRSVVANLPCMKEMGFSCTGEENVCATDLLSSAYRINFVNRKNREIEIYLGDLEGKEIVSVFIGKNGEERFSLVSWMKYKKSFDGYSKFCLTNYNGDFLSRLNFFLAELTEIFCHPPLASVLQGDVWEDVPFDWAGMR